KDQRPRCSKKNRLSGIDSPWRRRRGRARGRGLRALRLPAEFKETFNSERSRPPSLGPLADDSAGHRGRRLALSVRSATITGRNYLWHFLFRFSFGCLFQAGVAAISGA